MGGIQKKPKGEKAWAEYMRTEKEQLALDRLLVREAKNGATKKAEALIKEGANPNADCGLSKRALAAAIGEGRMSTAEALLRGGAKPDRDALGEAVRRGNEKAVRLLLAAGGSANGEGEALSPLSQACRWGKTKAAEALIEWGADVRAKCSGGMTALHWAAVAGNAGRDCARLLLSKGAKSGEEDDKGRTPLDIIKASKEENGEGYGRFLLEIENLLRVSEEREVLEEVAEQKERKRRLGRL